MILNLQIIKIVTFNYVLSSDLNHEDRLTRSIKFKFRRARTK